MLSGRFSQFLAGCVNSCQFPFHDDWIGAAEGTKPNRPGNVH